MTAQDDEYIKQSANKRSVCQTEINKEDQKDREVGSKISISG